MTTSAQYPLRPQRPLWLDKRRPYREDSHAYVQKSRKQPIELKSPRSIARMIITQSRGTAC